MPRKPHHFQERFQSRDRHLLGDAPRTGSRHKKTLSEMNDNAPPAPRLMEPLLHTGLLMAALRVWELKHGIHDCF